MPGEYLTVKEIESTYPNEWVVLDRLKKDRYGHAVGGVVIAHGTDKEAVYGVVETLPTPYDVASWYTGPIPEDVLFLL